MNFLCIFIIFFMTLQSIFCQNDFNLIKNLQKIVRYEFYLKMLELKSNITNIDEILGVTEVRKNIYKTMESRDSLTINKNLFMDSLRMVSDQVRNESPGPINNFLILSQLLFSSINFPKANK